MIRHESTRQAPTRCPFRAKPEEARLEIGHSFRKQLSVSLLAHKHALTVALARVGDEEVQHDLLNKESESKEHEHGQNGMLENHWARMCRGPQSCTCPKKLQETFLALH